MIRKLSIVLMVVGLSVCAVAMIFMSPPNFVASALYWIAVLIAMYQFDHDID